MVACVGDNDREPPPYPDLVDTGIFGYPCIWGNVMLSTHPTDSFCLTLLRLLLRSLDRWPHVFAMVDQGKGLPKGLSSPGSLVMSCDPFHPSPTPFASVHHPDYPGCLPQEGSVETPLDTAFLCVPRHFQPVGGTGHCLAFNPEPKVYYWYVTSEESGLRTGRFSFPPAVSRALPGPG